ncbi:hypothetical protein HMPREF9135_0257 [Segatella baroniae F0067]|uniref:Uncharacterized protein n=1 Tax=Segatella baroniae F0067 TaxID=1115809 RepID=U2QEY8_9BACT|nr:hypothetical protein HMPREF9135_0257 [Segatella baroniae F0067]
MAEPCLPFRLSFSMKISGQITSLKAIYLAKFAFLKVIYAAKR